MFIGSMLVDIVPFPFLPAFTVMIALQLIFKLNIWLVIIAGVAGSILGRYILTLYIPKLSAKIFNTSKNEDVQYLGKKMKQNRWKGHGLVLLYSLLPLPTTPLFLAAGMARLSPLFVIPGFFVGKFISDTAAVTLGDYAAKSTNDLVHGIVSWKTWVSLAVGLVLLCALLFIDWRTLLQQKKLRLRFKIWKKGEGRRER
ncbi:MAG: hypothetical protein U0T73_09135 [Chitinophagales bacterium]